MKKRIIAAVLTACLMLGLAGCGAAGGEKTADTADSQAESTGGSFSVTVDEIKERGTLVIGGEMNYEPYEYLDENDKYTGYDIEIWEYIAKDLGVELEIIDLPFSGALTGLDAGKYDAVGCVVGVNPDRAKSYLFSSPVMINRTLAVKSAGDSSISSVEDCGGKTVGVQVGSSAEREAEAWNEELTAAGAGFAEVKKYTGTTDAFMDLSNGGIDVAVEAEAMIKSLMSKTPGQYEIIGQVGENAYLSYAFRQSDTEFMEFVSDEIKKMKEDGTLSELQQKYFEMDIVGDLPDSDFIPEE